MITVQEVITQLRTKREAFIPVPKDSREEWQRAVSRAQKAKTQLGAQIVTERIRDDQNLGLRIQIRGGFAG